MNKFIDSWLADRRIKDRYSNKSMGGQQKVNRSPRGVINTTFLFLFSRDFLLSLCLDVLSEESEL